MTKHQRKHRVAAVFVLIISALFVALPVYAHFPWINLEDGGIAPGKNVKWTIGWGHRFPLSGFMKNSELEEMVVIGPDGASNIKAASTSELEFQSEAAAVDPGAYIVAAKRISSFYTKTTEGAKRQSKKGLENVIRCSHSNSCMKAIVNVGDVIGKADAVVGHSVEIVPLANPAALKTGDYLPFRILLKGQPLSADFVATYAGFSVDDNVYAYTSRTDKNGMGRIRILSPGNWLVKVNYEEPFAETDVCDVESYLATLTFEIQ